MRRDWVEVKTHLWNIPLRPRCFSEEEEGKVEETREEEAKAKTEVEGTIQKILKEGATIQISTKAKAGANRVVSRMLKEKGMINPVSNVTIVKNMVIMLMNVERSRMIWEVELVHISLEKISTKIICFWLVIWLKKKVRIYGF